ncbi:MAG TPA: tRNA (adenosine(37)-N6)-threonylcarbamoyltransferase complex ATPase subunit type 1 TsaE [Bacteroidales bacterium]|nr:tRNA (adenosine(37)-N6)-threonylcarbamoyltransferase complex ATPase subunit type 1 TsaE [Bacteroidales bacterium]
MITLELKSINEVDGIAKQLLYAIRGKSIVCFYGTMGVGKTTLIKAMCKALGVADVVTSPTFALVNEYTGGDGKLIYHFDFYRIKNIDEVYDFGYEEYFYNPNALCLVEWPEMIESILPTDDVVRVTITVNADSTRTLQISTSL